MNNLKKEMKASREWQFKCTKDIWLDGDCTVKGDIPVFKKNKTYTFVFDSRYADASKYKNHPVTLSKDLVYVTYDEHNRLHYWSIEELSINPFVLIGIEDESY